MTDFLAELLFLFLPNKVFGFLVLLILLTVAALLIWHAVG